MKRIAAIACLMLVCLASQAQKVTSNIRDEKGVRIIETDMRAFYVDRSLHMGNLSYHEKEGNGYYVLMLGFGDQPSRWVAQAGQELMMKDANGEITTIQSHGVSKASLTRGTRSGVAYMCATHYILTDEQANVLRTGLTKVRVNYTYEDNGNESYFDVEIPEDFTAYLKKAIKNIDKTIPQPVTADKSVF